MVRALLFLLTLPFVAGTATAEQIVLKQEKAFSVKVTPTPKQPSQCTARVRVSYAPIDEDVDVTARLTNETCGASSGEFTLVVRLRGDDDAALEDIEHVEPWSREDAAPFFIARRFPLPKDKSLVRVTARRVRCRCAPLAQSQE